HVFCALQRALVSRSMHASALPEHFCPGFTLPPSPLVVPLVDPLLLVLLPLDEEDDGLDPPPSPPSEFELPEDDPDPEDDGVDVSSGPWRSSKSAPRMWEHPAMSAIIPSAMPPIKHVCTRLTSTRSLLALCMRLGS